MIINLENFLLFKAQRLNDILFPNTDVDFFQSKEGNKVLVSGHGLVPVSSEFQDNKVMLLLIVIMLVILQYYQENLLISYR